MRTRILTFLMVALCALLSCKKDNKTADVTPNVPTGNMDLRIETYGNNKQFELDSSYTTANGDDFTCDLLRFYISGVKLRKKGTNEFVELTDYYFLFDQQESQEGARVAHEGNAHMSGIPLGDYDQISYNIGIPQPRNNDTTSFNDVLSKSNNMYWDWSKEFVFFKFEGKSSKSTTGALLFHVAEDHNLKRIFVDLKSNPVSVKTDGVQRLHVRFDVDKIFTALNTIDFAKEYSIMNGLYATEIADNYAECFSFLSIQQL